MTRLMKHKDKKKYSQTIYYKIVCCTLTSKIDIKFETILQIPKNP